MELTYGFTVTPGNTLSNRVVTFVLLAYDFFIDELLCWLRFARFEVNYIVSTKSLFCVSD
jgi:hypothetical protein